MKERDEVKNAEQISNVDRETLLALSLSNLQ